jgi:hypothetical protein
MEEKCKQSGQMDWPIQSLHKQLKLMLNSQQQT